MDGRGLAGPRPRDPSRSRFRPDRRPPGRPGGAGAARRSATAWGGAAEGADATTTGRRADRARAPGRHAQGSGGAAPLINLGAWNFLFSRHDDLYVVAVTKQCVPPFPIRRAAGRAGADPGWPPFPPFPPPPSSGSNSNAAMCFQFMSNAVKVLKGYFGGVLNENILKKNFVLVYEILDEIMDFGYPQILDEDSLKQYILQKGFRGEQKINRALPPSSQLTGAVAHRREGIKYKKNEAYLDVVEHLHILTNADGVPLRSEVKGKIMCKAFLSGMPTLKIGLNEKAVLQNDAAVGQAQQANRKMVDMADVKFHQCVNLSKFEAEKSVSFTPPDGEFELMTYRVTSGLKYPFKVLPNITRLGRTRIQANVTIKSLFPEQTMGMNVRLHIPVPKNTAKVTAKMSLGKYKYDASKSCVIWKLKRFPGETELSFSGEIEMLATTSDKKPWAQPPLSLTFDVPMFGSSGLQILYLKIWEKAGYSSTKWVRKICKCNDVGDWSIRT